jgi:hypothetical protein
VELRHSSHYAPISPFVSLLQRLIKPIPFNNSVSITRVFLSKNILFQEALPPTRERKTMCLMSIAPVNRSIRDVMEIIRSKLK